MTRAVAYVDPRPDLEEKHQPIPDAYKELSTRAFAAWMRLMVATDNDLKAGRPALAKLFRRSQSRTSVILKELVAKGYIIWIPSGKIFQAGTLKILRRASISGPNRFVKFSSFAFETSARPTDLFSISSETARRGAKRSQDIVDSEVFRNRDANASENEPTHPDGQSEGGEGGRGAKQEQAFDPELAKVFAKAKSATKVGSKKILPSKDAKKATYKQSTDRARLEVENGKTRTQKSSPHEQRDAVYPLSHFSLPVLDSSREQKSATKNTSIVAKRNDKTSKAIASAPEQSQEKSQKSSRQNSLSIRIRESSEKRKTELKKKAKLAQAAKTERAAERLEKFKGEQTQDDYGVSFMPAKAERERYLALLRRPQKDKERQKLLKRLGYIFRKEYAHYAGLKNSAFTKDAVDFNKACRAAELCIYHGVTPRQVLRYWDANIGNFHSSGNAPAMRYPSISFLASNHAIEAVAVANVDAKGNFIKKKPKPTRKPEPERHGWGTAKGLRKGYRDALEAAGFDTSRLTDVHLTDLQKGAIHNAKGGVLHVGSETRAIFNWTIANLAPSWIAADKAAAGEDDE